MEFIYSTGGRENYFKALRVGDCAVRAICNATGIDYIKVYSDLKELAKHERITKRNTKKSSVRDGTSIRTLHKYIERTLGWTWHPCCGIGVSKRVHLLEDELPFGTLICQVSNHLTCVKDKVLYDTYDCTRDGTRMVYGYWSKD